MCLSSSNRKGNDSLSSNSKGILKLFPSYKLSVNAKFSEALISLLRKMKIFNSLFFRFSLLFENWGGSGELGKCLQYLHRLSTNLAQWPTESFSFDAQVSGFQYWVQVTFSVQRQWSTVFSPFSIPLWLYPLRSRDLKLYCRRILKNITFHFQKFRSIPNEVQ